MVIRGGEVVLVNEERRTAWEVERRSLGNKLSLLSISV